MRDSPQARSAANNLASGHDDNSTLIDFIYVAEATALASVKQRNPR